MIDALDWEVTMTSAVSKVVAQGFALVALGLTASALAFPASGYYGGAWVTCNPQFTHERSTESPVTVPVSDTCPFGEMGGSANSSSNFGLKASSYGSNQALGSHTNAGAWSSQKFLIEGAPAGVILPINYNFSVHGNLFATSSPRGGIVSASTSLNIESNDSRGGTYYNYTSAEIRSIYGRPYYSVQGGFYGSVEPVFANVTFTRFDGEIAKLIDGEDLDRVLADSQVHLLLEAAQNPIANGFFANAGPVDLLMERVRKILFNADPSVFISLDVQYGYQGIFSIAQSVTSSSFLGVTLKTGVAPYPRPSEGRSDFSNTVSLSSVTFQDGFDSTGLDNVYIVLQDGSRIHVSPAAAVPEPSAFSMLLIGGLALAVVAALRRRRQGDAGMRHSDIS